MCSAARRFARQARQRRSHADLASLNAYAELRAKTWVCATANRIKTKNKNSARKRCKFATHSIIRSEYQSNNESSVRSMKRTTSACLSPWLNINDHVICLIAQVALCCGQSRTTPSKAFTQFRSPG